MIDTHAHLDQPEFKDDLNGVVSRASEAGVQSILCVGTTAASSAAVLRISEENKPIWAAVGIQPNYASEAGPDDWGRVVNMASHRRVVAIGETGLDRHWDYCPFDLQQEFLDCHLRLAQQRDLPVIIHCREAEADLLPMLLEAVERAPLRGVLHSFSGNAEFAADCLRLGLHVSFSGMVTYPNKKFAPLREVARLIPENRLLLETDSPYLVPHPLRGKEPRNEPANLRFIAQVLAEVRNVSTEDLVAATSANARHLFALPGATADCS
ncbi:MAG: TatD family hydrolase [Patescibacteria group bacterium]|nr:TatD family hydrolase [Patescibacteria group bacterium]